MGANHSPRRVDEHTRATASSGLRLNESHERIRPLPLGSWAPLDQRSPSLTKAVALRSRGQVERGREHHARSRGEVEAVVVPPRALAGRVRAGAVVPPRSRIFRKQDPMEADAQERCQQVAWRPPVRCRTGGGAASAEVRDCDDTEGQHENTGATEHDDTFAMRADQARRAVAPRVSAAAARERRPM